MDYSSCFSTQEAQQGFAFHIFVVWDQDFPFCQQCKCNIFHLPIILETENIKKTTI